MNNKKLAKKLVAVAESLTKTAVNKEITSAIKAKLTKLNKEAKSACKDYQYAHEMDRPAGLGTGYMVDLVERYLEICEKLVK